jgi:hypothetical protein
MFQCNVGAACQSLSSSSSIVPADNTSSTFPPLGCNVRSGPCPQGGSYGTSFFIRQQNLSGAIEIILAKSKHEKGQLCVDQSLDQLRCPIFGFTEMLAASYRAAKGHQGAISSVCRLDLLIVQRHVFPIVIRSSDFERAVH